MQLTYPPAKVAYPLISPDGKRVSYILVLDVKTQKWSDLEPGPIPGGVINWTHSPDFKYVYYTTGGAEPKA